MHRFRSRVAPTALLVTALALGTACGNSAKAGDSNTGGAAGDQVTLRLGYLPNVTHAPAIIGLQNKTFEHDLGSGVKLETSTYNSGTEETTAILAGSLDAAFVGPNPAINAYQKSGGSAIRIVSGVASGGAFLVVKPDITSPADLRGKQLATPSLGNTQDVALRSWLESKGYRTTTEGGGDVEVVPQDNATTVTAFQTGAIDGAWLPEPYATKLEDEGGKVLVDEASLWPGGKFVTTNLVVTAKFLHEHPNVVTNLLRGLISSIELVQSNPDQAEQLVSEGVAAASGKALPVDLVKSSFRSIEFTLDPIASSLQKDADAAKELGFIDSTDLKNIYDLTLLNRLLTSDGRPEIKT